MNALQAPVDPTAVKVISRLLPWVARLAWIIVAVIGGAAVEAAVEDRSRAVQWFAALGGWTVFAIVALALLIPSVLSLAVVRVAGPLALATVVATMVGGASATDIALLATPAIVANSAFITADLGQWMVQASAYGDEQRLPLRPPVAIGAAAAASWLIFAAFMVTGPLALAAGNLAVGVPLSILALAAIIFVGPRWLRLAQRWLVFVPAGIVLHDPVVLADTVMVRTTQIEHIGLARANTKATDLTGPTSGYVIEIRSTELITAVLAFTPKEPSGRAIRMATFLVAPTRPGEALQHAVTRGLPVG